MTKNRAQIDVRIGRLIKGHRLKQGMSIKELADLAGLPKTTLFQIETGMYSGPRYQWVHKIAKALGTDLVSLVTPLYRKKASSGK